jgi:hypothetical protein
MLNDVAAFDFLPEIICQIEMQGKQSENSCKVDSVCSSDPLMSHRVKAVRRCSELSSMVMSASGGLPRQLSRTSAATVNPGRDDCPSHLNEAYNDAS